MAFAAAREWEGPEPSLTRGGDGQGDWRMLACASLVLCVPQVNVALGACVAIAPTSQTPP